MLVELNQFSCVKGLTLLKKNIGVVCDSPQLESLARTFSLMTTFPFFPDIDTVPAESYLIHFACDGHYVSWLEGRKRLILKPDFVGGANAHRRKFGGGRSQLIAKAVGIQGQRKPSILDMTAGLGGDAFVLASLGCRVTLQERSPVAHILLESALTFALSRYVNESDADEDLRRALGLMQLEPLADAKDVNLERCVDVVYLDPMFPERKKKSALVKKDMRAFHVLIGDDADADALLACALECAQYRVVVKRPKLAPYLAGRAPTYQLAGKSTRFDIYALKSFG